MKLFSVNTTLLSVCIFAILQVWASPAETIVSEAEIPSTYEKAVENWWNNVNEQYYNRNAKQIV